MRKQETSISTPVTRAPVPVGLSQGLAGDDFWASNAITAPGGGGGLGAANQPQPFRKIHRLLRGRYVWALLLCPVFAGVGFLVGWKSQVPMYVSNGLIEVKPILPGTGVIGTAMPYFDKFLKTQAMKIQSSDVISAALMRKEWTSVAGDSAKNLSPEYVAGFTANLTTLPIKDSNLIQISFQQEDPKYAAAACNAVMNAYKTRAGDESGQRVQEDLRTAQLRRDDAGARMRVYAEKVSDLCKDFGSPDLGPIMVAKQEQKLKLETTMMQVSQSREMAEGTIPGPDGKIKQDAPKLSAEQIANVDPKMRQLLAQVDAASVAELQLKSMGQGDSSPKVQRAHSDYQVAVDNLNYYYHQCLKTYSNIIPSPDGATLMAVTPETVRMLKDRERQLAQQISSVEEQIKSLGRVKVEIDENQRQITKAKDEADKFDKQLDQLSAMLATTGQITLLGPATEPTTPDIDKRKQFALMGTVLGGGLPLGLLLLVGLLDSRYRYSDEAGEHSTTGMMHLPLLGILPNLPDRLSDPAQASIAAHCVHQIRTMLQLNNTDDRRCFTVTSATSGDGKTSLTLALGLSFAASGSRTLLIDADLVGAGLTGRLGMSGPEGILEAMTSGHLLNYVRSTDVADLSILPVGMAQLHHAGIFSPAAVRRLVNEARKHFEIILIDTGPILGSIEATPVCAASDGVILTVARGQQRPMVEKALAHLKNIGAVIAGVVFNRAQARDFEQSISGISMRSAGRAGSAATNGNGNGHSHNRAQPGQYGPVAKAVASSVKPEKN